MESVGIQEQVSLYLCQNIILKVKKEDHDEPRE